MNVQFLLNYACMSIDDRFDLDCSQSASVSTDIMMMNAGGDHERDTAVQQQEHRDGELVVF